MSAHWFDQLAAVGWKPLPHYDASAKPMVLPCGPVIWIAGQYHGVDRDAWLALDSGIVMLHGGSDKDDCDVAEFVRRLTAPPVAEKTQQGRLF